MPVLSDNSVANLMTIGFFTDYIFEEGVGANGTVGSFLTDGKKIGKISEEIIEHCIYPLCTGITTTTTPGSSHQLHISFSLTIAIVVKYFLIN